MRNYTYNGVVAILKAFATAHLDIRTFETEDLDQMSEITSKTSQFPMMFVSPVKNKYDWQMNGMGFRVHIYDRLLKDRTNITDIRSKTNQIITDLDVYLRKDDLPIDLESTSDALPFSSELMTDVTGWYVDVVLSVPSYETCKLPFAEAPGFEITCPSSPIYKDGVFELDLPSGERFDYTTDCDPAIVTVNGEEFKTLESGETLDILVEYESGIPVGTLEIADNKVLIPNPIVLPSNLIYIRPEPTGEIYIPASSFYPDYCDSWRVHTGLDTSAQPSIGIPMLINKSKRYKTIPDNTFNHKWRFTGKTGGYWDVETSQYKSVIGAVTTYALAFPDNYLIDHSTGLGWQTVANATNVTWALALTEIDALSFAGFSDWFLPNLNEMASVIDYGYGASIGQSGDFNPIFNPAVGNGNKWTATTRKTVESRAWVVGVEGGVYTGFPKTSLMRYMACRYHFNN